MKPIDREFYDEEYFTAGTKSNYAPYGAGPWARWLTDMIVEHLKPDSVLDVGCAYGFVIERLRQKGVEAFGFDISPFAIGRASSRIAPYVWVGDAADPNAYLDNPVDLVVASELPEHLTEEQAVKFLLNARNVAKRALLLIAMITDGETFDPQHERDKSHINVKPVSWWVSLAAHCGWEVEDASAFNNDVRSSEMQWAGRFLLLSRP